MRSIFTFVLLIVGHYLAFAQKSPSKFGDIDIKNLQMTTSPIDSTAGAVVLFDFGYCTFDHNFEISFERHTRIKILNSTEFDRANIKIPHADDDRVEKLKAASYNLENGEIVESEVSKKDMFDEKVDENLRQQRFSIPNVKEGSIIEYTYRVNYGGWQSLSPWYFQQSIPTLYSEYVVKLPEYFIYKQLTTGYIQIDDIQKSLETGHYNGSTFTVNVEKYIVKDIPAFKNEPYMTTAENYIGKIKYVLSNIEIPGRVYNRQMASNYMELSKSIAKGDYFGKKLEKNKFLSEVIEEVTAGKETDNDKIRALYEYVRDNYEIDYDVIAEGLRRILDLKKGYPSDINRMLVSLLREAGYDANIVKTSTRNHGLLHPIYPARSNFNYYISCVTMDGQDILMDPTAKGVPYGMLPEKCLNDKGLLISDSNPRWVDLTPKKTFNKLVYANLEMDEEGTMSGNISISRKDYSALTFRTQHKGDIDDYIKDFSAHRSNWTLTKHEVKGFKELNEPVTETIQTEIEGEAESLGDIIYLNPMSYGKLTENPFKTETRLFPVDYGMPVIEKVSYRIKIPEGYKVDEAPAPVAIGLPDNAGSFIYQVQVVGEYVSVTSLLNINKITFSILEYPYLKELYTQITAKQAEQIVLKKL